MADFSLTLTAWYFDDTGTLRECIVLEAEGPMRDIRVTKAITLDGTPLPIPPTQVLIERPD